LIKKGKFQQVHCVVERDVGVFSHMADALLVRRQPASTTRGTRPLLKPYKIHHVDVLAWLPRLRVAPSRTSPISTIHSQNYAFAWYAAHNHPTRHDFISARQAGTSHLWIYPAVTDPSIEPISDVGYG